MASGIKSFTDEPFIYFTTGILLAFIYIVFSKEIAIDIVTLYGSLVLLDFILFQTGSRLNMNGVTNNSLKAITFAVIAVVILTLVSGGFNSIARNSEVPTTASETQVFQSVYQSLQSQYDLQFEKIPAFYWLLFGLIIPVIETRLFFGRMLDFIIQRSPTASWSRITPTLIIIFAIVSAIFSFFHTKVRGIDNNVDIFMTFLFGMVSCFLVFYSNQGETKEIESATWFHIIWNSAAIFLGR